MPSCDCTLRRFSSSKPLNPKTAPVSEIEPSVLPSGSTTSSPAMAWRGSVSRSITMTARSVHTAPSSSSAFRHPSPPLSAPRLPRRVPSFSSPFRPLGALGCVQSLMPMQGATIPRLTSHLSAAVRACCELSQGTVRCTCPDC